MEKPIQPYTAKFARFTKAGAGLLLLSLFARPVQVLAQRDTTKKLKQIEIKNSAIPHVQTITPSQQLNTNDFVRYSAFNVADAIRNFAGVNVKDYGGIGGLKTVSVRSLGADNTAVLYNGVQLNNAQTGQIDLSKFNLNNIQEVTLYNAQPPDICQTARAFASASVLSIKTIVPVLTREKPYQMLVGIKGGSFGLVNPYLQWQQLLSKHWSFVINGLEEYANGQFKYKVATSRNDSSAIRANDQINAQQIDAGLYWTKSDSVKFNLQFNYYHSDRGVPGPNIINAILPNQYLHNRDYFIQAGYEHLAINSLQFKLNTRLSQSYLNYFNSPYLNIQGYIDEHYTQREAYQSVAVAYEVINNWQVSVASDVDVANLQSDVYSFAFPTRLSLFNVLATDITAGRWHFQANLLNTYIHDHVKTGMAAASHSKFTPTIMASVEPFKNSGLQLRAFYKAIYRNPTFSEQYYYAIAPRLLRPEYTDQYNLGASYSKSFLGILDYIALTADVYYNNVKDKIIFIPARSPVTPSAVNLGSVEIKGLDVNLKSKFNLTTQLKGTLSASYTHQNALDVTNPTDSYYLDQIPYVPVNTLAFNTGVNYQQLGIYYNQILSSSRYSVSNHDAIYYLPAYSISDASVVYRFSLSHKPVMVSGEVNNLFNKSYTVVQNYPMPGRSLRFTLQITI
ncbi:MAG: TonB-dependent receptor plug domain-containing protein [Mucilaginibacter sp.]|uniref:TonB-dependent receptor n=1 Tax=Mucilaginibacter sp. TaxID=1882438 RepID=UPI0032657012